MSMKQNCWEFKRCGREVGGVKETQLGICPATRDSSSDGLNGGKNAGRICWAVAGSFCGGDSEGTFAKEKFSCISCDFFQLVEHEEGIQSFEILTPIQLDQYKSYRSRTLNKMRASDQEHYF
jgi:hypothetical protein